MDTLSSRKKKLFKQGFEASEAARRGLAYEIKQIDRKIKLESLTFKDIMNDMQVVDDLIFINQSLQRLNRKDLMSKIRKMGKSQLSDFLGKTNLKRALATQNTDTLIRIMESEFGLARDPEYDKEDQELMDVWSTADIAQVDEVYKQWDKEKAVQDKDMELE